MGKFSFNYPKQSTDLGHSDSILAENSSSQEQNILILRKVKLFTPTYRIGEAVAGATVKQHFKFSFLNQPTFPFEDRGLHPESKQLILYVLSHNVQSTSRY